MVDTLKWHQSMALFFQLCPSITCICCIVVVSLLPLLWITKLLAMKNGNRSNPLPPEAGGAWPIIGHLHLFTSKVLPHKLLAEMADKYGPIFRMRNGVQNALVVSSWEMARECFVLNDKAITSRPRLAVVDIMAYGEANVFSSPYGPYWRSLRKIVSLELLLNHRLDVLSHVVKEETDACINKLYEFWFSNKKSTGSDAVLVDLKQWFSKLSMDMIVRIIFGGNCVGCESEILHLRGTLEDLFHRLGSVFIGDVLPFLRWLDLGGQEKAMRKTAKDMDDILERWLREHKKRSSSTSVEGGKDFMDVMRSVIHDSRLTNDLGFDGDKINKATCVAMLVGASDTTLVVLTWAISLLLNNRDMLKKAQVELDSHVGKDRQVSGSDIPKLGYLQAILKETLRLYSPAPLSAPREFNKDCVVGGYHVKKGTRLIVNI